MASESDYLSDEQFADELVKLEPTWASQASTIIDVLRAFDDAGILRPRLRVVLTPEYAQYQYDRQFVRDDEHPDAWAEFDALTDALSVSRQFYDDPAAIHPLQRSEILAAHLRLVARDEPVDWKQWTHVVGNHEMVPGRVRSIHRHSAVSYYARWQLLHAWALLERQTFRVLLDPRTRPIDEVWQSANYDFNGSWLVSQAGDSRYDRLLELLEKDGWLTALYRSRAVVEWAELRTWEPRYQFDTAAEGMTVDARWVVERNTLVPRCQALAAPWNCAADESEGWPHAGVQEAPGAISAAFRQRVRALIALWGKATEGGHTAFARTLHQDIEAASTWAPFAFDTTFALNDEQIGVLEFPRNVSLGTVLRPARTQALSKVRLHLHDLIESFNTEIGILHVAPDDFDRFLCFMDDNELWAWTVELAQLLALKDGPRDTARDRKFLHLRSLALLNEQIQSVLAGLFGTERDRSNVARSGAEAPLKIFLTERLDWRRDLWATVKSYDNLTRTDDGSGAQAPWSIADAPSNRLAQCIRAIHALRINAIYAGAAKTILTHWAFRNFGAHRFSRDARLLQDFGPHLTGAVIFCPLFYWKIATTLG